VAAREDEFDVLTFFIYVMILLTVIVAGFALLNRSKVTKLERTVAAEVRALKEMEKLLADPDFRDLIAKDREGQANLEQGGGLSDFQQLYINSARRNGVDLVNHTREGMVNRRGGSEWPFRLTLKDCRVEHLVKFLVEIETKWPGAKVKQIVKLDYNERSEKRGFDAVVVLTIFKAEG